MLDLPSLCAIADNHRAALAAKVAEFSLAGHHFAFNSRPAVMGVINLSPDSWYRESVCLNTEAAIQRGLVLRGQGADIVDIGAESTLSHAARVSGSVQKNKLVPVIEALRQNDVLVSAETYDEKVARTCLEAGANIINLTGTVGTDEIYRMAAAHRAAVIICFVEGKNVRAAADYQMAEDPIPRVQEYFKREIDLATSHGLSRIFIDPGLGFYYQNLQDGAVRVQHQMKMFLNTFRLRTLGWPICHALPHAFEYFQEEVRAAEPFFAALALLGKTDLFRTHEVPRVKAVLETMKAF